MTVNPVSGASAAALTTQTEQPSQTLGKDAFLELLVASLKYQDPSQPMSTSELMNQTTQLATMEQLTEMTQLSQETFALQARTSATALMGQHVTYVDADGPTSGTVEAIDLSTTEPTVIVGGVGVPLAAVMAVGRPPAAPTLPADIPPSA